MNTQQITQPRQRILILTIALLLIFIATATVAAADPDLGWPAETDKVPSIVSTNLAWTQTYDGGGEDKGAHVTVGPDGYIYVTGRSHNGSDSDFRTIKYTHNGVEVWNVAYDAGGDEYPYKVAVDDAGFVYVSGQTLDDTETDLLLVKYDSAGIVQWVFTHDSGVTDMVSGAIPDAAGDIYVAGVRYTNGSDSERYFIKLDSAGNTLWNITDVRAGRDRDGDIVMDAAGNLYVDGFLDDQFRTTKYDSAGTVIWDKVYNPGTFDYADDIAIDAAGNVYVSGFSTNNSTYREAVTLKYDNAGNLLWDQRYDAGTFAYPGGIAVDADGHVFVGVSEGTSPSPLDPLDMRVIEYDGDGCTGYFAHPNGFLAKICVPKALFGYDSYPDHESNRSR